MVEQVPALIRTFSFNAERHATSHVDVACPPTRPPEPTVWYAQSDKPHTAELYEVNKIPCALGTRLPQPYAAAAHRGSHPHHHAKTNKKAALKN